MDTNAEKRFKGDELRNRYRITGTLKTISPLHIGTGEEDENRIPKITRSQRPGRAQTSVNVSTVIKDVNNRPYLPGSALKGVVRHWLLHVLQGVDRTWADHNDYESAKYTEAAQEEQLKIVKEQFSWLELLFGTPFHEGKVEFWDASCVTPGVPAADKLLHWREASLTYVDTSVAIDPVTGTAKENLLYKAEVVPPGVAFAANIAGQNLSEFELGLILFGLQGFNSEIYPIRVGARGGRGFGRMQFTLGGIYALEGPAAIQSWIKDTMARVSSEQPSKPVEAGYYALPALSENRQRELISKVKTEFLSAMAGVAND
jgi:CRISPR-associated RAMP protein (TIGR02581 family)